MSGGVGSASTAAIFLIFVLFILLVALILFVWLRCCNHIHNCQREIDKCQSKCNSQEDQCGALERRCNSHRSACQTHMKTCGKNQHTLLGMWSFDVSSLIQVEQASNITLSPTPMLLSVATPQGNNPTATGQTGTSSVIPAAYSGTIQAMTVELSGLLTGGSVPFTVTINGVPTTLTYTYTSATPSMFSVTKLPVDFSTGDTIGIQFSTNSLASASVPITFTAQLWGTFHH
jgi:hypothetical protein